MSWMMILTEMTSQTFKDKIRLIQSIYKIDILELIITEDALCTRAIITDRKDRDRIGRERELENSSCNLIRWIIMTRYLKVLRKPLCNREIKIKCKTVHFLKFNSSRDRVSSRLCSQLLLRLPEIIMLIKFRIFIIRDRLILLSLINKFSIKGDSRKMKILFLNKNKK